jgi:hypothetical protein
VVMKTERMTESTMDRRERHKRTRRKRVAGRRKSHNPGCPSRRRRERSDAGSASKSANWCSSESTNRGASETANWRTSEPACRSAHGSASESTDGACATEAAHTSGAKSTTTAAASGHSALSLEYRREE